MNDSYLETIDKGTVIAIIPARGGSKGVPKKNIRLLHGHPLIAYSIASCKLSKEIDRVIVSTDSEEIADIAKRYGAEVPFLRPQNLAVDTSNDYDFMEHFIIWLYETEHKLPEYIVHMRPTTPLRDVNIVDEAIVTLRANEEATSLRSAHKASESPFKWFVKNDNYYHSMITGLKNDMINYARQGFPDVYIPDGYVDVLKTKFILQSKLLHGDRIIAFESPHCIEVDSASDFEYLEYQCKDGSSGLLNYMNGYK